jgi:hypothetical protein
MIKLYTLITIILFLYSEVGANDALYIRGAEFFVNTRINTTVPTLRVNGSIYNEDGDFTNSGGLIEVSGDWVNDVVINNYISTGIERFVGNTNQAIDGTWNGTTGNRNQFYDLEIHKTSATGQYVSMNTNVNINSSGGLSFTGTHGIVRTDVMSHGSDGSAYARELYIRNPSNSKFSGYSTGNGATTRYIEGKLRRQINGTGSFYFPIGVAPASLDGMEAFEIDFSSNPNNNFLGYLQPATMAPIHRNILCDIGKDPNPNATNPFPDCVGGPDGYLDLFILEASNDLSHEWVVTPSGSTTGYDYDISFFPGTALDPHTYYAVPTSCTGVYAGQLLRVVGKNGVPGGDASIGPFGIPFGGLTGYEYCDLDFTPSSLDITLSNQTSFSSFRILGTSSSNFTVLPVELIRFEVKAINEEYLQLTWVTASEVNNAGFEIERSVDGIQFITIGYVEGQGTTNDLTEYILDDRNVLGGINYYYRLKQKDFDGTYSYSDIRMGRLSEVNTILISELYPNPTDGIAFIDIVSPEEMKMRLEILNMLGQRLGSREIIINKGYNKITLHSNEIASGTYMIMLSNAQQEIYKKLVKNH